MKVSNNIVDRLLSDVSMRPNFELAVRETMVALGWTDCAYDAMAFRIQTPSCFLALSTVFAAYKAARREQRRERLRMLLLDLRGRAAPLTADTFRAQVLPRFQQRVARLEVQTMADDSHSFVGRPFDDILEVVLVCNMPNSSVRVLHKDLAQIGISEAEAFETALQNLNLTTEASWTEEEKGVFHSPWRDNYGSARLLLPDMIRRLPIQGDPVAMIPNNNQVLVAGSGDQAAIESMMRLALRGYTLLYPRPLILQDDVWMPFEAPKSLRYDVAKKVAQLELHAYTTQQPILQQQVDDDAFVASFQARVDDETRVVQTTCSSSAGLLSLLPKTDTVGFSEPTYAFLTKWDVMERVLGPRQPEPNLWPVRYRRTDSPTDDQAAALRELAE
jgi:hypothetical protein